MRQEINNLPLSEIKKIIDSMEKLRFELTVGYSYTRSRRLEFRCYMERCWVPINGRYVMFKYPDSVIRRIEIDWIGTSKRKKYGDGVFEGPVGTVLKVIENNTGVYYLLTKDGLKELKHESEKVVVYKGYTENVAYTGWRRKRVDVVVWYYRNKVYLPDGTIIEDIDPDPKLYTNIRLYHSYTLSELDRLKEDLTSSPP